MLIVALVLAVIGLASLVAAVVTGNELIAWVCIAASVLGVILLIIDAIREKAAREMVPVDAGSDGAAPAVPASVDTTYENFDAEYPDDVATAPADLDVVADEEIVDAEPVVADVVDDVEADPDAGTGVDYVTSEDADTTIEYVTEADDEVKGI